MIIFFNSGGWSCFFLCFGCCWSGDCESRWIGQVGLESLNLLEFNISGCGDGHEILETIGDTVWNRSNGWVSNLERDGSDVGNTTTEFGANIIFSDVQDGWAEDGARIINMENIETILERFDVQHLKESGFGRSDLVTNMQEWNI